jgi:mevalonate kinase
MTHVEALEWLKHMKDSVKLREHSEALTVSIDALQRLIDYMKTMPLEKIAGAKTTGSGV